MGNYIEVPHPFEKVTQLATIYGAQSIAPPATFRDIPPDKALICVIRNTAFEAALYVEDAAEFGRVLRDPSGRPRWWMTMDRSLVERLMKERRRGL